MNEQEPTYNKEPESEEDQFVEFLMLSGMADSTIKKRMVYFRHIHRFQPLTQESAMAFLREFEGFNAKAFLNIYLKFKRRKDIELPKLRGKGKKRLIRIVSEEDYEYFIKRIYQLHYKYGLMLDLCYYCGLRREEVCEVKPMWFDLENYDFEHGGSCRLNVIGKNNKERIVVVPAPLMKKIIRYMEQLTEDKHLTMEDKMFPIGLHRFWAFVTTQSQNILGKRIRPHELRHTRATLWIRKNVPIQQVQKRLGHASISTTEGYLHQDPEEIASQWEEELKQEN